MAHTLTDFKSALRGGGARPNLFEVIFTGFSQEGDDDASKSNEDFKKRFSMLCKAAALPASNIAPIDVPFRGRIFKVAGDRTFDTWTVTVINDIDFSIRRYMESWMQRIGQYQDSSGAQDPFTYMSSAQVFQLGRNSSSAKPIEDGLPGSGAGLYRVAGYNFYDIFPTNISQIDLSYDTSDTVEEFTVEFQVQYWTPAQFSTSEPAE
jgi:hypothetical protein